jgi:hypothetical protein
MLKQIQEKDQKLAKMKTYLLRQKQAAPATPPAAVAPPTPPTAVAAAAPEAETPAEAPPRYVELLDTCADCLNCTNSWAPISSPATAPTLTGKRGRPEPTEAAAEPAPAPSRAPLTTNKRARVQEEAQAGTEIRCLYASCVVVHR